MAWTDLSEGILEEFAGLQTASVEAALSLDRRYQAHLAWRRDWTREWRARRKAAGIKEPVQVFDEAALERRRARDRKRAQEPSCKAARRVARARNMKKARAAKAVAAGRPVGRRGRPPGSGRKGSDQIVRAL